MCTYISEYVDRQNQFPKKNNYKYIFQLYNITLVYNICCPFWFIFVKNKIQLPIGIFTRIFTIRQ